MKKRVIIFWHSGGRMANQLWQAVSIYAYCLEKGFDFENHSFFEFAHLFNFKSGNKIIDLLFYNPYPLLKKILPRALYADPHDYFYRSYYKIYVKLIEFFCRKKIVSAPDGVNPVVHYLDPTGNTDKEMAEFENNAAKKIYLSGWLFRNPAGIEKYRKEIRAYFAPREDVKTKVDVYIGRLRSKFKNIIGIHIRQGDYKNEFGGGKLFFSENEAATFMNEYLDKFGLDGAQTVFVLCSDGKLDSEKFNGFNVSRMDKAGATDDLFSLSQCDAIFGSDSTFGGFASYYGDKPFIIFKKEGIDWEYYRDKRKYFQNKYSITNV